MKLNDAMQKMFKLQRQRQQVKNALCTDELKEKMLSELDQQLQVLEKEALQAANAISKELAQAQSAGTSQPSAKR